ncbi:RTA1 like protein [Aspergillus crustosus]
MLLFLILTVLHSWKLFKTRTWFCIAFTIGGLFQIIGYIGRALAHDNTTTMGPYIVSNIFILLSPTLFAASIYMTLGRIIRAVGGEHLSVIRVSRLTKTFVFGATSYMWANIVVAVGGLAIQLISFSIFWLTAVIFEKRIWRKPTPDSRRPEIPRRKSLYMLYILGALIMIRSVFRIVEYVLGTDGYPLRHEWTLYVFDSVPMLVVMVVFFVWYPSKLQQYTDVEGSVPLTAHSSSNIRW